MLITLGSWIKIQFWELETFSCDGTEGKNETLIQLSNMQLPRACVYVCVCVCVCVHVCACACVV